MSGKIKRNSAVILCAHVASGSHPIRLAIRSEPEDENDSGWQILCDAHEESWEDAKVWALSELLEHEPSLENYIDAPPGTTVIRDGESPNWSVVDNL